ncbi:MAG: maleylpyruvate isomerase N-terminal domain-containing protein [Chloroflexi bacterium]|nr:maleylpyruvate isomerase N-terminal domain-containing protein [Chloroflexota bacterium]
MSADKAAVMRQLEDAWRELQDVVESLPERELETPGVVEDWSVKDLLGHIAFWSGRAARHLDLIAAGRNDELTGPDSDEALNEWNARESAARKNASLADMRGEWVQSFEGARRALEAFPEEKLEMPLWEHTVLQDFAWDTFVHYKEHAQQIREWVKQLETTEE